MNAETDAACAEALNKLADYFGQCAEHLEPWRKESMIDPKVIAAQIDIWLEAQKIARAYANRKIEVQS